MFLSAINALTLSPALCGDPAAPHHGPRRGVIGMVMRCDRPGARRLRRRGRPARARLGHRPGRGRRRRASASVGLSKMTPTGFLPEDDQGALLRRRAAAGRRLGRAAPPTSSRKAETILREEKAVADFTSVIGLNFIDNYSQSNAAFMVVTLKPFEERKDADLGAAGDHRAARRRSSAQIQGGTVVPLAPPPIIGLGTGGGFTYVLQDLRGGRSEGAGAGAARPGRRGQPGSAAERACSPPSRRPTHRSISISTATRCRCSASQLEHVFQALQASLGGYLCQRHEPVRPHLAGAGAGRGRRPRAASTTSIASMCATPKAR